MERDIAGRAEGWTVDWDCGVGGWTGAFGDTLSEGKESKAVSIDAREDGLRDREEASQGTTVDAPVVSPITHPKCVTCSE